MVILLTVDIDILTKDRIRDFLENALVEQALLENIDRHDRNNPLRQIEIDILTKQTEEPKLKFVREKIPNKNKLINPVPYRKIMHRRPRGC